MHGRAQFEQLDRARYGNGAAPPEIQGSKWRAIHAPISSTPRPRMVEQIAQTFGRNRFRAAGTCRFLFEVVAGRDDQPKSLRILAREPFDNRIGRLSRARIENLDLARFRFVGDGSSAPIEDHHHAGPTPILVIAQFLDQDFTGRSAALLVKAIQFRPGENDAVTVNEEIMRPHREP
jgi:hypothetical protein